VQFCIMTSSATAADTKAFFAKHSFFGLTREQTQFFQQVRFVHALAGPLSWARSRANGDNRYA